MKNINIKEKAQKTKLNQIRKRPKIKDDVKYKYGNFLYILSSLVLFNNQNEYQKLIFEVK